MAALTARRDLPRALSLGILIAICVTGITIIGFWPGGKGSTSQRADVPGSVSQRVDTRRAPKSFPAPMLRRPVAEPFLHDEPEQTFWPTEVTAHEPVELRQATPYGSIASVRPPGSNLRVISVEQTLLQVEKMASPAQ